MRGHDGRVTAHRLAVAFGDPPAYELLVAHAARFLDVPAATLVLVHRCPRCGSDEHGRPQLLPTAALRRPPHVSLSRAGSLSLVAVTDAGPVGVDVERHGAAAFPGFEDVALHPAESWSNPDPTTCWVRKEAVLKASGLGLAVDPRDLLVDAHGVVTWSASQPAPGDVLLHDLDVPGHVAAVAVLLDDPSAVVDLEVNG